jgi:cysteine-S-conjugate beta-lyase
VDGSGAYSFERIDRAWLAAKPGAKWARCAEHGQLAAWVADMDMPPAAVITDRLQALVAGGDLGYPDWRDPHGSPLRELFAARMAQRYGWHVEPGHCQELNDVVQGIQMMLHLGSEPGDGVVLHLPSYPPFLKSIESMHRRLEPLPARLDATGWVFDLDALDATLRERPSRVLMLCHPHNPTGRVFARPELERLAAIAEEHDLLVVSDEIHAELVYEPHGHVPFASVSAQAAARTVTITSASKAFNLAGLRWAIAHIGPSWLRDRLHALPNHLFGVPNLTAVAATTAAWTEGEPWREALVRHLDANRAHLAQSIHDRLPGIVHVPPEATYLAWMDCRALGWAEEPAERFAAGGVRLSPGADFAAPGFARLNFATSPAVLDDIVERMAAVVAAG